MSALVTSPVHLFRRVNYALIILTVLAPGLVLPRIRLAPVLARIVARERQVPAGPPSPHFLAHFDVVRATRADYTHGMSVGNCLPCRHPACIPLLEPWPIAEARMDGPGGRRWRARRGREEG
ncbi:hypothetical protein GGS23DRAFT_259623 [Durotheca rogersii]|uniref:uncharacterized protein n=1 Tax=Durotheca rogersii TaxID=419775 RepID=UPI00221EF622|nr:uncharacterized protein GGS23DRAFT_259623 [Durotheca rogersii]KAI5859768.1 hypothetical protein GGS23DRAFT_259623 [Durotheca rogersii]